MDKSSLPNYTISFNRIVPALPARVATHDTPQGFSPAPNNAIFLYGLICVFAARGRKSAITKRIFFFAYFAMIRRKKTLIPPYNKKDDPPWQPGDPPDRSLKYFNNSFQDIV